jgi:hypothetical protein
VGVLVVVQVEVLLVEVVVLLQQHIKLPQFPLLMKEQEKILFMVILLKVM